MYSTYFINNKTYGTDDINTVLARLTTQGVSLFRDTGNTLLDIETAIASFVDSGVEMYDTEGCKVVALANDKFKISKGCCWMPSGTCIIFDDEGYVFTPNFKTESGASSSECYIYLRQGGDEADTESNEINVIISPEKYTDNDVPLASISGARVIIDRRIFARSKVFNSGGNIIQKNSVFLGNSDVNVTVTPSFSGYSYICMLNHNGDNHDGGKPIYLTDSSKYIGTITSTSIEARREGNDIIFDISWAGSGDRTLEYMLF